MAALMLARWWRLPGAAEVTIVQAAFARRGIAEVLTRLVDGGAVEIIETPIGMLVAT